MSFLLTSEPSAGECQLIFRDIFPKIFDLNCSLHNLRCEDGSFRAVTTSVKYFSSGKHKYFLVIDCGERGLFPCVSPDYQPSELSQLKSDIVGEVNYYHHDEGVKYSSSSYSGSLDEGSYDEDRPHSVGNYFIVKIFEPKLFVSD